MPRQNSGATRRVSARREVERWCYAGLFPSDVSVDSLSPQHWRALKELDGRVYIRLDDGESAVPASGRRYPCWIEWAGSFLPAGTISHDRAERLVQEARNNSHTNVIYGLSVYVQAHGWQTTAERQATRTLETIRRGQVSTMPNPVATPTTRLSDSRRRTLDRMIATPVPFSLNATDEWVVNHVISQRGILFCTRHEHGLNGWNFKIYLEFTGTQIHFAVPESVDAIREFAGVYRDLAIWVRNRQGASWQRFDYPAGPTVAGVDWAQPLTPAQMQALEEGNRRDRQRLRDRQMWQEQYEAIPRSRRRACQTLYAELSVEEQRTLGVIVDHSIDDLAARDFVLLSAELGRRALADEADDDVLNDNKDDYPTESV
jgi:hypothetical protein